MLNKLLQIKRAVGRFFSLKIVLALLVASLAIVLVLGFTLLSADYFRHGMHVIMAENLEKAADYYADHEPKSDRQQPKDIFGYWVSRHWEDQPEKVRRRSHPEDFEPEFLSIRDPHHRNDTLIFFMARIIDGEKYYVSHQITRKTASPLVRMSLKNYFNKLSWIGGITIVVIMALIGLIYFFINRPISAMWKWTCGLEPKSLSEPVPDFVFPDLNRLAGTIHGSLNSVQSSLEREHRFLRHASHELRTPIAVVSNNVELLRRLLKKQLEEDNARPFVSLDRIDRAGLTMKNLTETLLWLSRDSDVVIPRKQIQLDTWLEELVDENRYLLESKDVEIIIVTDAYALEFSDVAARIVLTNLIRNAFQHTWAGRVEIHQNGAEITINNVNDEQQNDSDRELGFGLGLQLAQKLCEKLGWKYRNDPQPRGHNVFLRLG